MPSVTHNMIPGPGAYHMVNRGRSADGEGILGRSRDLHDNNSFPFDPLTGRVFEFKSTVFDRFETTTHPRYAPQKLDSRVALLEKVH